MILPTRVLPSNAPPLQDDNGVQHTSRVLQEHSGNRQIVDFNSTDDYQPKYSASTLSDNAYPRHHPLQPPSQQLYRPPAHHRPNYRYGGYGRPGFRCLITPQEEAKLQYEAERLYRRFRQSDQYIKYRARQSKEDKGNGDQKWPDHLEKAFFRALVQHPPMGRRKLLHKDKQRGRNELIADCIQELTGESRTRKQVSSHIQVLKPFVENDPQIMKWLSKDDLCAQMGRGLSHSSGYGVGRQMSNYPVTAPPQPVRSTMATYSRLDNYALQSVKHNLDVFEPTEFQMFVQRKLRNIKGEDDVERLHEYTKSVNNPLADELPMNDWQTVNRDFPLLAAMCSQRTIDCNVLIAEASIAFPQETWKDKDGSPLPGVELGISFLCSSHHLPPTPKEKSCQVVCNNSFYDNGNRIKDYDAAAEVRLEPSSHVPGVETQIKFGSTFWARTLGRLATKLLDTSKDHRDDVTSTLRAINALQEVFVLTDHGPERILVIHWSFRQSTSTCGRASWRKLLLPSTQTSQYDATVKLERADSMFEPYTSYGVSSIHQSTQTQAQPALQSPFEYDNSSGSALSSETWPTSISEGVFVGHQPEHSNNFAEDNFDFSAGNINIAYEATFNFADFDSSAFTFDAVTGDFAADPALQDYSTEWCDSHSTAFDPQHAIGDTNHFTAGLGIDGHEQAYDNPYSAHYDKGSYVDQQAFGGAGQDMIREEDALAALADASYIASTM